MLSLLDVTKDQPYGKKHLYDYRLTKMKFLKGRCRKPVKIHITPHNDSLFSIVVDLESQYRRDVSRFNIIHISMVEKIILTQSVGASKPFKLRCLIE